MQQIKHITIKHNETEKKFTGRTAWTLKRLLDAGSRGVAPIDHPAPRWSDYVFKLRRAGLPVETKDEKHGGPYSGKHGRYVLREAVEVVSEVYQ